MTSPLRGTPVLSQTFASAKAEGRTTFMPYWMLGYPDLPTSIQVIQLMLETGVDAVEIGIPFTDPLADGVVIQAAAQKALESGVSLTQCLEAVRQLRVGDQATPFLMMGYLNPFMAYGLERLTQDAAHAGVDGFIIPDLPPDEASEMLRHTRTHQLALIELLAPTSNVERIRLVASTARGFIYLVSVTGVTGARTDLPIDLSDYIQRVRAETKLPLAVGFGVSNAQHAAQVSQHADGVIVASALIREYNQNGLEGLQALLKSLKNACKVQ